MPRDLKDYLPDLDTVLQKADRTAADQKHRRALTVEPAPKRARAAAVPNAGARGKAAIDGKKKWKTIALGVAAVVLPLIVFAVLYEKIRGPVHEASTSGAASANAAASSVGMSGSANANPTASESATASTAPPAASAVPSIYASAVPSGSAASTTSGAASASQSPPSRVEAPTASTKGGAPKSSAKPGRTVKTPSPAPQVPAPTSSIPPQFVPLD